MATPIFTTRKAEVMMKDLMGLLEDVYSKIEDAHGTTARKMLTVQEQNLRKQGMFFQQYANEATQAFEKLRNVFIDINVDITNKTKTILNVTEQQLKNLPESVAKVIREAVGRYNELTNQFANVNSEIEKLEKKADIFRDLADPVREKEMLDLIAKQDELRGNILKKIVDHNLQIQEVADAEESKLKIFTALQDDVVSRYERQIDEMKGVLDLNEEIYAREKKEIDKIQDKEERRSRARREQMRFERTEAAARARMEQAQSQLEDVSTTARGIRGMTTPGNIVGILQTGLSALGIGGIAFGLRDAVAEMRNNARALRELGAQWSAALGTLTSPQDVRTFVTRAELYQMGRRFESMGIPEETTTRVGGGLAQAGIPIPQLVARTEEAVLLGIESGLGPEKVGQIFDRMYRELRVPVNSLGETFNNLKDRARSLQIPMEEFFNNLSSLQDATKQYGYTLFSSTALVERFAHQIRQGTITVQDLVAVRENIQKLPIGERAFLGEQLIQRLPQTLREQFQQAISQLGGGPIATAQALKSALEGSPVLNPLKRDAKGRPEVLFKGFANDIGQEIRKQILAFVTEQSQVEGRLSDSIFIFEEFLKQFAGIDLSNMPERNKANILEAFNQSGIKGVLTAMKDGQKNAEDAEKQRSQSLLDALEAGRQTAKDHTTYFKEISTTVTDLYRTAVEQLRISAAGLFGGSVKEFEEMRRTFGTAEQVAKIEDIFGGSQALRELRFDPNKARISGSQIEKNIQSALNQGIAVPVLMTALRAFESEKLFERAYHFTDFARMIGKYRNINIPESTTPSTSAGFLGISGRDLSEEIKRANNFNITINTGAGTGSVKVDGTPITPPNQNALQREIEIMSNHAKEMKKLPRTGR